MDVLLNISDMKMTDEYFEYSKYYQSIYGASNTVILLQNGSFFEMYGIDNEKEKCFSEIRDVCDILDIYVSRKNKGILENSRANPLMAGFPVNSYEKHVKTLIENGYTVVIYEQREKANGKGFERFLSQILSPSTQLENSNMILDNQYCMCIYFTSGKSYITKNAVWTASVSLIDVTTGNILLYNINSQSEYERKDIILYDLIRLLKIHFVREMIIFMDGSFDENMYSRDFWRKTLDFYNTIHFISNENDINIIYDTKHNIKIKKIKYQREFFSKLYDSKSVDILEYLDIERHDDIRISLMTLLQFIWNHNRVLLENVGKPVWGHSDGNYTDLMKYMRIENNSMEQIGLFNKDTYLRDKKKKELTCVFDVVNKTKTTLGHRFLRNAMCKPLVDCNDIQKRYDDINNLIQRRETLDMIRNYLSRVSDIERLHRKIEINYISPSQLSLLYNSYKCIVCILDKDDIFCRYTDLKEKVLYPFIELYERTFIDSEMNTYYLNNDIYTCIFQKGRYTDIDMIFEAKESYNQNLNIEKDRFEQIIQNSSPQKKGKSDSVVKLEYSDKDKYYLTITQTKLKIYNEYIKKHPEIGKEYTLKTQTNLVKIFNSKLEHVSECLSKMNDKINDMSKQLFRKFVSSVYDMFGSFFRETCNMIGYIDFIQSGAYVSIENHYVCPKVVKSEKSFIDCVGLRHLLVEKILQNTPYVPNDFCIGREKNGYLIFGTNACGKSVFMKSVGICIVMSQIGYHVPCESMEFSPFHNILTRMSGSDDPLKGHSSFAVEMIELNLIIERATDHSLVLGDEICHGTEHVSGVSIMASSLIYLCEKRVPFVFASHLHQLSSMKEVTSLDGLAMKHLTVIRDIKNDRLIYERKLKDGSGDATYGIEVAKYIISNMSFIRTAERIQRQIKEEESCVVSSRLSRYNRQKFLNRCEICDKKATQTHHIIEQHKSNERNMVYHDELGVHIDKDHYSNLIGLCDDCHEQIHHGKDGRYLHIRGYVQTTSGVFLEYSYMEMENKIKQ